MKLATIRTASGTAAVRIEGEQAVEVGAADVSELLRRDGWQAEAAAAAGARHQAGDLVYAALVPSPRKIICVGLNYRSHILEMGRELPAYPTLLAKFANSLLGANDDIVLPSVSDQVDWEAELGVVIGTALRRASLGEAAAAIAGDGHRGSARGRLRHGPARSRSVGERQHRRKSPADRRLAHRPGGRRWSHRNRRSPGSATLAVGGDTARPG